jgi:hypothetical protein
MADFQKPNSRSPRSGPARRQTSRARPRRTSTHRCTWGWAYERYDQDEDDSRFPTFITATIGYYVRSLWGQDWGCRPYVADPDAPVVEIMLWPGVHAELRAIAEKLGRTIDDVAAEAAWYAWQMEDRGDGA